MKEVAQIPTGKKKEIVKEKVLLKKVLYGDNGEKDIEVEVIPFDPRNDDHVDFAYAYSDMLYRVPSDFRNVSQAAREYVRLFMVHTVEDEKKEESKFNMVINDLRACRNLFHQEKIQKDINDFFVNA